MRKHTYPEYFIVIGIGLIFTGIVATAIGTNEGFAISFLGFALFLYNIAR